MMAAVFTWIVIGGAHRIVAAAYKDDRAALDQSNGDVTSDEALKLLATEWGRHVRGFAAWVVRDWEMSP